MSQSSPTATTQNPDYAKWRQLADAEFRRVHLDLERYSISVLEQGDSVIVMAQGPNTVKGGRGNTSNLPGYEVEISRKDLKVLRSNYVR